MSLIVKVVDWAKNANEGELIFAGIDPGVTGAVGFLHGKSSLCWDIPTVTVRDSKNRDQKEYDREAITETFLLLRPYRSSFRFAVEQCIPTVRPSKSFGPPKSEGRGFMFADGMHRKETWTAMKMGVGFGFWLGILHGMSFPCVDVHPTSWKGVMGLIGKDKEVARQLALKKFKGDQLLRKGDHNRAEALLIAEWHRRLTEGA